MPRAPSAAALFEQPDGDRIVEAPRPGARRIEVPDAADALVVRQVAVAEEHHVGRLAAQLRRHLGAHPARAIEDVHEEEAEPIEGDARALAGAAATEAVDVAGAGRDLCQRAQLAEHLLAADVAAVKDVVDAAKDLQHLRAQEPVSVGDDADAHAGEYCPGRSAMLRAGGHEASL